jgi:hypothetical protein
MKRIMKKTNKSSLVSTGLVLLGMGILITINFDPAIHISTDYVWRALLFVVPGSVVLGVGLARE